MFLRPVFLVFTASIFLASISDAHAQCLMETVAGGGTAAEGDGGPALEAELLSPTDSQVGPDGLVYIADWGHHRIRRITADGKLETIAGTGVDAPSGDGGPAASAGLRNPLRLAFGPDGSLYILEAGPAVRRISPDGVIQTVAGGHNQVGPGEGVPALEANLFGASSITVGPDGSIYLAYTTSHLIRRIRPDGTIVRVAGSTDRPSASTAEGVPALEALLSNPKGLALDPEGRLYFLDSRFGIRRILADGTVETFLDGVGSADDGAPLEEAAVSSPGPNLAIDDEGLVYWADRFGVRRIGETAPLETVWSGFLPEVQWFSMGGGRYFAVGLHVVVELSPPSNQAVIAGIGPAGLRGDGGPARQARLGRPVSVDVGSEGELYIADLGFGRVREVRDGVIRTIAGTGEGVISGDDGPAAEASFRMLGPVAAGAPGVLFVADHVTVRRIDPDGSIHHHAGNGSTCDGADYYCGDGGPAVAAPLNVPIRGLAADRAGNLYILHDDRRYGSNTSIRKVSADGTISTVSQPSSQWGPLAVSTAPNGDLIVSDTDGSNFDTRFWRVGEDGEPVRIPAPEGFLSPGDRLLGADGAGNLFSGALVRISTEGYFSSLIRPNAPWAPDQGDGGPPEQAYIGDLWDLAVTPAGDVYLADLETNRIRRFRSQDCPALPRPVIARRGVVNAATFFDRHSPGGIFSIFGALLGPETPVGAQIENGAVTTELAGVRVLVNGVPAPLTFVSANQINAIAPFSTPADEDFDSFAIVAVEYQGLTSEPRNGVQGVFVTHAAPGLFELGGGQAAALNQNGSINGAANPAKPGEIVSLFGTGGGVTNPPSPDGAITGSALARPVLPVQVTVAGEEAEVLYAGSAPGLAAGVLQVNVRLPAGLPPGAAPVLLTIGEQSNAPQDASVMVGQ